MHTQSTEGSLINIKNPESNQGEKSVLKNMSFLSKLKPNAKNGHTTFVKELEGMTKD